MNASQGVPQLGLDLRLVGLLAFSTLSSRAWRSLLVGEPVGLGHGVGQGGEFVGLDRAGEDAVERVIILGRDRVELVVVAAGAGDAQAHQAAGDDVDPVVDDLVLVVEEPAADGQEAERGEGPLVVAQGEAVGGDLLDDEAVVRLVLVERPDDVVAIGVRIRDSAVSSVKTYPLVSA